MAAIERVIWTEVIKIAKGSQSVYEAADNILQSFPSSFDEVAPSSRRWLVVGMKRVPFSSHPIAYREP